MGDDTWMQLAQQAFAEAYPYPSFNVQDLHTVDDGVWEVRGKGGSQVGEPRALVMQTQRQTRPDLLCVSGASRPGAHKQAASRGL